eukprot:gb/GFBE01045299.1/.p1 GENE.gb/GFBE01045299.1/~~gb/GFBE01045299.1/.p1  ORF type:complete len:223 (+),score=35.26 gb/GFBE01045299.1/:1-669(+)
MHALFNCCSGVQEEQSGKWICTPGGGNATEEVVDDPSAASGSKDGKTGLPNGMKGVSAPAPVSVLNAGEGEKETAKYRLQRLIRDFAHDSVGPGLAVEVQSTELPDGEGPQEATLRMDRRLSQVEIWQAGGGSAASLIIPLQQVESIVKGFHSDSTDEARKEGVAARDSSSLTMLRKGKPEFRLTFDSAISRDRAYTCLRIFQMSVDQTGAGSPRSPTQSPR